MSKTWYTVRADGRLTTTVIDEKTGKRKYIYGRTPSELKKKIYNHKEREIRGELFTKISSDWWEEAEPTLAIQSKRGYLRAKKRADVEFTDISIKEIQSKHITAYLNVLAKQYASQKTVDKYRLVLNLIFKYAVEHSEITHNPCADAKAPKGLKKAHRDAASPEDEKTIKEKKDGWLLPYFAI
jgi:integrase